MCDHPCGVFRAESSSKCPPRQRPGRGGRLSQQTNDPTQLPAQPGRAILGIRSSFEQPGYRKGCPDLISCSSASGHSCQLTLVLVLMSSVVWVLGSTGFDPLNRQSRSSGCRSSWATVEGRLSQESLVIPQSRTFARLSDVNLQGCLPTLMSELKFPLSQAMPGDGWMQMNTCCGRDAHTLQAAALDEQCTHLLRAPDMKTNVAMSSDEQFQHLTQC